MAKTTPTPAASAPDPLDAAKVTAPRHARHQSAEATSEAAATPAAPAAPPVEKDRGPAPTVGTAPTDTRKQYRVKRDITISWGAQTIVLRAGKIVSVATHGKGSISRFQACGVALEELPQ